MRSKVADRIRKSTPEEIKEFVRLYSDITVRINQILKSKNMTQKDLADKLEKKPSEINKWLKGEHNFTLKSLAKLQVELGSAIIAVPEADQNFAYKTQSIGKVVHMRIEHCAKSEKPYSMEDFDSYKIKQRKSKAYAS